MAKNYDERSVVASLKKIPGVSCIIASDAQSSYVIVKINKNAKVGIHQLGKLDYLKKYCKATVQWITEDISNLETEHKYANDILKQMKADVKRKINLIKK